jgi:hypothetical protein
MQNKIEGKQTPQAPFATKVKPKKHDRKGSIGKGKKGGSLQYYTK